ncbi:hypothetical protein H1C71_013405, partial [Ictidomys tridecemlineatus]
SPLRTRAATLLHPHSNQCDATASVLRVHHVGKLPGLSCQWVAGPILGVGGFSLQPQLQLGFHDTTPAGHLACSGRRWKLHSAPTAPSRTLAEKQSPPVP